ncbi:MAG: hypothetical protein LUG99_17425 [Lachnospiraceae bacterium]|nr:hypothetical protein [Lachnospiraceae bacterium]
MTGIMQKLYNGALYPAEQIVSRDAEYFNAIREQGDLMQQLEEKLAPEDYKIVGGVNAWNIL